MKMTSLMLQKERSSLDFYAKQISTHVFCGYLHNTVLLLVAYNHPSWDSAVVFSAHTCILACAHTCTKTDAIIG